MKYGKQITILKDIIFKYHPNFTCRATDHDFIAQTYSNPKIYNVEALVEETLSHLGGYAFIDAAHMDFSDGTDSKTASVALPPIKEGNNTHRVSISGLRTFSGNLKTGDLRVTMYVAPTRSLQYYMLPHSWWINNIRQQPSASSATLIATWNRNTNEIPKLKEFQLPSFEALAKARPSK